MLAAESNAVPSISPPLVSSNEPPRRRKRHELLALRSRAIEYLRAGMSIAETARTIRCAATIVSRWNKEIANVPEPDRDVTEKGKLINLLNQAITSAGIQPQYLAPIANAIRDLQGWKKADDADAIKPMLPFGELLTAWAEERTALDVAANASAPSANADTTLTNVPGGHPNESEVGGDNIPLPPPQIPKKVSSQ